MFYLYWLAAFTLGTPLILGLPLLSRNRVYRIATLFAGMNVGIVALYFFMYALRWNTSSTYLRELHIFLTTALPVYYIASLIVGSTLIARYYLTASTRAGAAFATFGVLVRSYVISTITGMLIALLSLTVTEGFPSFAVLMDAIDDLMVGLSRPNLSLVGINFSLRIYRLEWHCLSYADLRQS